MNNEARTSGIRRKRSLAIVAVTCFTLCLYTKSDFSPIVGTSVCLLPMTQFWKVSDKKNEKNEDYAEKSSNKECGCNTPSCTKSSRGNNWEKVNRKNDLLSQNIDKVDYIRSTIKDQIEEGSDIVDNSDSQDGNSIDEVPLNEEDINTIIETTGKTSISADSSAPTPYIGETQLPVNPVSSIPVGLSDNSSAPLSTSLSSCPPISIGIGLIAVNININVEIPPGDTRQTQYQPERRQPLAAESEKSQHSSPSKNLSINNSINNQGGISVARDNHSKGRNHVNRRLPNGSVSKQPKVPKRTRFNH